MAVIEFKNIETLETFKPILEEIELEQQKKATEQQKLKRGLYLLKRGHYWEGI